MIGFSKSRTCNQKAELWFVQVHLRQLHISLVGYKGQTAAQVSGKLLAQHISVSGSKPELASLLSALRLAS